MWDRKVEYLWEEPQPARSVSLLGFRANVVRSGENVVLDVIEPASFPEPDDAGARFWSARRHDRPARYARRSVAIASGSAVSFWVQGSFGAVTKVLAAWSRSAAFALELTAVQYSPDDVSTVKIVDQIEAISAEPPEREALRQYFRYEGALRLEPVEYYRVMGSRRAGEERWVWDGADVPPDGTLAIRGGTIRWDVAGDQLIVNLDQSALTGEPLQPAFHHVEFGGKDVFGRPMHATHQTYTPASIPLPPRRGVLFPVEGLIHLPEELHRIVEAVREGAAFARQGKLSEAGRVQAGRLIGLIGGHPAAHRALQALAAAVSAGRAELDSRQARLLLAALLHAGTE